MANVDLIEIAQREAEKHGLEFRDNVSPREIASEDVQIPLEKTAEDGPYRIILRETYLRKTNSDDADLWVQSVIIKRKDEDLPLYELMNPVRETRHNEMWKVHPTDPELSRLRKQPISSLKSAMKHYFGNN